MDSIEQLIYGLFNNNRHDVVGRDEVNDYTIDTCYTADAGYETAIMKDGGYWIVVARYSSREDAKRGHDDWTDFCLTAPLSVYSVQLDRTVRF